MKAWLRTRLVARDRYGLVLILLVAAYMLSGTLEAWIDGLLVALAAFALFLTAESSETPRRLRLPFGIGLVVIVVVGVGLSAIDSSAARATQAFLAAALFLGTIILTLRRVLSHERISDQTILGAMVAYILVGFFFGAVYRGTDQLNRAPIFGVEISRADYTFYSFTTQTTLGLGDITPQDEMAKKLTAVEALVGQLFLATLIARLVGLYGMDLRRDEVAPDPHTGAPPD